MTIEDQIAALDAEVGELASVVARLATLPTAGTTPSTGHPDHWDIRRAAEAILESRKQKGN